jgi:hypothetical protein
MTNGCFDILHAGHVTDLEQARKLVVTANGGRVGGSFGFPGRGLDRRYDRAHG